MPKFIDNMIKDFLNIYLDEKNIREAYGKEYADRFSVLNPITGKKIVSVRKVLMRIFIVFMVALCLFLFVRIMFDESLRSSPFTSPIGSIYMQMKAPQEISLPFHYNCL